MHTLRALWPDFALNALWACLATGAGLPLGAGGTSLTLRADLALYALRALQTMRSTYIHSWWIFHARIIGPVNIAA